MSWLSDYIKRTPQEVQQDHKLAKERAKTMEDKVQQGIADGSIFLPGYPKTWAEKQLVLDSQTEIHKQSRIKKQRERLAAPYLSALDNIQEDEEE